ncbi:hypothetical protein Y032_0004g2027 [Ancylostoma ceylanicum]|uniref:Uncharacterized protein n=1 Tax=Ancylostoma ceylanicum TaxID=53326 RepID=A0A016VUX5_9BILA|nr:hypothetical protein Y032_0004g2027 [Ancylostoma ceylanicum]
MGGSGLSNPRPIIDRILKMWWGKVQQVGLGSDNKYPGSALYTFGNVRLLLFIEQLLQVHVTHTLKLTIA